MKNIRFLLIALMFITSNMYADWNPYPAKGVGTAVGAKLAPLGDFATHSEDWGYGGWHSVTNDSDLLLVPEYLRKAGMSVYSRQSTNFYILKGSTGSWTWEAYHDPDAATQEYIDSVIAGLSWKQSVKTYTNTPPNTNSITFNDRYLIETNATGDWTNHNHNIAVWETNSTWSFLTPTNGWATVVEDVNEAYVYNGSEWILFTANALYTWGDGLSISNNDVSVNVSTGLVIIGDSVYLDTTYTDSRYLQEESDNLNDVVARYGITPLGIQVGTLTVTNLSGGTTNMMVIADTNGLLSVTSIPSVDLTPYAVTAADFTQFTLLGGTNGQIFVSDGNGSGYWTNNNPTIDLTYYAIITNDFTQFTNIGGTNGQVFISSGTGTGYWATVSFDTNGIVHIWDDFTVFTNLTGAAGEVFKSNGDGTGYWADDNTFYYPERREFPGINPLNTFNSIKGGQTLTQLSPYGFEPSGLVWHPTLQRMIGVGDEGNIAFMDYDGGNKTMVDTQDIMKYNGWSNSDKYDFEAVTLVDETDTNFVYIGAERLGPSATAPSVIIRCGWRNPSSTTTNTFWSLANILSSANKNQQLEALTWVPHADIPSWINYTGTNGLFLAARQADGKLFFIDVPLTNTASTNFYVLPATNLVYSWYPDLTEGTNRNDLCDMFWDRTYKVLYILVDETDPDNNDPTPNTSIGQTLYAYSLEANHSLIEWSIPYDGAATATANPEALGIGQDRNTIWIGNDDDSQLLCNIYRYDLQFRGEHDLRQRNVTMLSDPTTTDDTYLGYGIGSRWDNPLAKKLWICTDNTRSNAVWVQIGTTNAISSFSTLVGNATDNTSLSNNLASKVSTNTTITINGTTETLNSNLNFTVSGVSTSSLQDVVSVSGVVTSGTVTIDSNNQRTNTYGGKLSILGEDIRGGFGANNASGSKSVVFGGNSGLANSALGSYSFAHGIGAIASNSVSIAWGYDVIAYGGSVSAAYGLRARADDEGSWVWQGSHGTLSETNYFAHGNATFNINPYGVTDGFYIGETNLTTYLNQRVPTNRTITINGVTETLNSNLTFTVSGTGDPTNWSLYSAVSDIIPSTNYSLGTISNQWNELWLNGGIIMTHSNGKQLNIYQTHDHDGNWLITGNSNGIILEGETEIGIRSSGGLNMWDGPIVGISSLTLNSDTITNWSEISWNHIAITNIIPNTSNTWSLGSLDYPFADLYLGTNSIYIGGIKTLCSTGLITPSITLNNTTITNWNQISSTNSSANSVPYIGATNNVDLGNWNLTAAALSGVYVSAVAGYDVPTFLLNATDFYSYMRLTVLTNRTIYVGSWDAGDYSELGCDMNIDGSLIAKSISLDGLSRTNWLTSFTQLSDVPNSYIGESTKYLRVGSSETNLEFSTITWNDVDKSSSSLSDIATRSHTQLTDIGSLTHADIDNHIQSDTTVHTNAINLVQTTGNQSVDGIKTFTSFPLGPSEMPIDDYQFANKGYVDAASMGLTWKEPVLDINVSSPPTTNSGDRYVVSTNGTGDFLGHNKTIATYTTNWIFEVPSTGWAVLTLDDITGWTYSTASNWTQFASAPIYTGSRGVQKVGNDFRANMLSNGGLALSGNSMYVKVDGTKIINSGGILTLGPLTNVTFQATGILNTAYIDVDIISAPQTAQSWVNMPSGTNELFSNSYSRVKMDLTSASQFRIIANQSTAGFSNSYLYAQYSTDGNTFVDAETGTVSKISSFTTGVKVGQWTDLVVGARADTWWRIVGENGNGVADPAWRQLRLQFKVPSVAISHSELEELDYASSGHTGFQPAGDYVTGTPWQTDGVYTQSFTYANLVAGSINITNNLNIQYPHCTVYNTRTSYLVIPSEVQYVNTSNLIINLSGAATNDTFFIRISR